MHIDDLSARAVAAAERARRLGISQQQIASEIGVSQSQVSRVFSATARRSSRVFDRVCKYVETAGRETPVSVVAKNKELMEALQAVWDGTDAHAHLIARVIHCLSGLSEYRPVHGRGAAEVKK